MRTCKTVLCLLGLVACGGDDGGDVTPDAVQADAPIVSIDAPMCSVASTVVYLNRAGGVYTRAAINDASTNQSTIIPMTATIAAAPIPDPTWETVKACIASKFADFNIAFTDVDPAASPHRELVLVGNPNRKENGIGDGLFGVAPFDCMNIEQAIAFVDGMLLTDPTELCELSSQMIANTFGLDHVYACSDLMGFLSPCGPRQFVDANTACGEFVARDCCSGEPTQNSHGKLLAAIGPTCSP
ncbi:MAG: hypothetical protein H0T79_10770 [Deltaproteobacteria bacterium]|nr:hypothetical protein [Deltaproteobacteria bacterium]